MLTTIDSKYIALIVIDKPQDIHRTGGIIAAPVAKDITNKIAPILNITPEM